jgi:hypothetical protein
MVRLARSAMTLLMLALLVGATVPAQAQDHQRCFAETGQCIQGRIREFWEQNGGTPIFGLPITRPHEAVVDGQSVQVQWFERNRLELHPQNQPPYDVQIGRLGVDVLERNGHDWFTFTKGQAQTGCLFFEETGHSLCEPFLSYWQQHGLEQDGQRGTSQAERIALFGLPISEPLAETLDNGKTVTVQWFERARLEHHPDNPPPYQVLMGLLGRELHPADAPMVIPAFATVRVINHTGWQLHFSLSSEPYQGPWVVKADETFDLQVEPGDYRITFSSTCGGKTDVLSIPGGETKVYTLACAGKTLVP